MDITHPLLQEVANEAEAFCGRWFWHKPGPTKLVLVGPNGCGKTHVAKALCAAARSLAFAAWEKKWGGIGNNSLPSVCYSSWPSLVDALEPADARVLAVMGDAMEADFLACDELGGESDRFRSGKSIDALAQLLNRREHGKWTVFTTNVAVDQWPTKWDRRVADRLMRDSVVITLNGVPSYALRRAVNENL